MQKINTFPNFVTLDENHYSFYEKFVKNFPQHCDFTLNNLLIWLGSNKHVEYSLLYNNIVLKIDESLYDIHNEHLWYTILGNNDADNTLRTVFSSGITNKLSMVPDYFINAITTIDYEIIEDRANHDYILRVDDIYAKKGRQYENYRHQINYVIKQYGNNLNTQKIDLSTEQGKIAISDSFKRWQHINSFSPDGNDSSRLDKAAIKHLLAIQDKLPVKHQCIGVYINNILEGFSIFHIANSKDNIAMGNHIKYNAAYNRMFDYLVFETVNELKRQNVTLLNAEQDMGLLGLRTHKKSLAPFTYYKKYTIKKL